MDTDLSGRIAAQSAKQVIIQKMKDAEREVVYDEFKGRKGEIINGIVQRIDKNGIIVNMGQAEAMLPPQGTDPEGGLSAGRPHSRLCPGCQEDQQGTADRIEPHSPAFPHPALPLRGPGNRGRDREHHRRQPGAGLTRQDRRRLQEPRRGSRGCLRGR